MKIFAPDTRHRSGRHAALYAAYELAFTLVQFSAGILFLVGSWMFFYPSLQDPAIWCFVVGSAFFAIGPTLKLVRELHYAMIGDVADLAQRAGR